MLGLLGMVNAVLLGLVLIIGRPGYRGEDDRRSYPGQPYPPAGYPGNPGQPY